MSRFLQKLNTLIDIIERDYYLDQQSFQLLLESHWILSRASGATLLLPTWNLYMFQALNEPKFCSDKETFSALQAVTDELRQ